MTNILGLLFAPFILFNLCSGLVGLGWLFYMGEWKFALFTIATLLVTKFGLALLMFPLFPLIWLTGWLVEKKQKILVFIVCIFNLTLTIGIMTLWMFAVFVCVIFYADNSNLFDGSFWPYLLVGYGVALRPIESLAQEDVKSHGGDESVITAFLLSLAFIISIIYFIYYDPSSIHILIIFSTIACLKILYDSIKVYKSLDKEIY